jgi:hypothetical protein
MTPTNQNCMHEEIKTRINLGNSCYYSARNHLSTHLQSRNTKIKIYKNIILPAALYGCETWSLTLREEYRLRVFNNTVMRNIFGTNREEVTGDWRRLQNEELNYLFCSHNIIRVNQIKKNKLSAACSMYGREEKCIQDFGGKT